MIFAELAPKLLEFLSTPNERVGFILASGEIVEVENICDEPWNGFEVSGAAMLRYMDDAVATWHTHPDQDCGLSPNDWYGFRAYPNWCHLIVGTDGVALYSVSEGVVLQGEVYRAG